jgi:GrpB-like predicted nucleotidyltransferase (UPF0157 family)
VTPHDAPISLAESDPAWPALFEREAARIRTALGERALLLDHVGSTSVPGLAAKPIIDVVVAVADSSAEASYAPDLKSAGYVLRVREPDFHEHRMFRRTDPSVHLHVYTVGSPEILRMLAFRDRLRTDPADRARYLAVKRELAARTWRHVQDYADAKGEVVEAILARALGGPS